MRTALLVLSVLVATPMVSPAAEIVLPQGRQAFYASEPIELAVAGLAEGERATVELTPETQGLAPLRWDVQGTGGTEACTVPAFGLAPGRYALSLNGQPTGARVTVSSGVVDSPMLLSQTLPLSQIRQAGGNFLLGNAFEFGLLGPDGLPLRDLRGRRSRGLQMFETAIENNLPTIVYMYWTGYVTHKPWGSEKSWAEATMNETMRLFNFHTAQRLRRYASNIISVGTIDEPGLSWGRTPMGGSASGFPNWDERDWYEAKGWQFTNDPASRPDEDWMRYMTLRCSIIREAQAQAKTDLKTVWPDMVFSTDLYAPHAIMDGTDPLSQQVNDIPCTHVFLDWGMGRAGVVGAVYLEKAHDPTAPVAHAMNGQLFGPPVPQPQQRNAYRLTLNGLLAAGLRSNWWLNTTGMTPADLAAVNEPARRLGPLFAAMRPADHDTAILWSFTEMCMRQKEVARREAAKAPGERLRQTVTGLPPNSAYPTGEAEVEVNAYSVGGNYREQILLAHHALSRAGYAAHIIHERLLPKGALSAYRTLVIVGQTFPFPPEVTQALERFLGGGGRIVADATTTIPLEVAIRCEADLKDPYHRWAPLFLDDENRFATVREASFFKTNWFMDEAARQAAGPFKAAMQQTESRPALLPDSPHLIAERHVCGDAALIMVLNAYEELPTVAEDERYLVYNHASYTATYRLSQVSPASTVFLIEGGDWSRASRLPDPTAPQTARFEPGEMKLYLVLPREPQSLTLQAEAAEGVLAVSARLQGLAAPWPLQVTVTDPAGVPLYSVWRATDGDGTYSETFPLGLNAVPGEYQVRVSSQLPGPWAETSVPVAQAVVPTVPLVGRARVLDADAIRKFLATRPDVTIALGPNRTYEAETTALAAALAARGMEVQVVEEREVMQRVRYPRVWDPYIAVHKPLGEERLPEGATVEMRVTVETTPDGGVIARNEAGENLGENWVRPGTLATVTGDGYIDFAAERFYEPGCRLYVDGQERVHVALGQPEMVQASQEVRQRWSRPWTRLSSYLGTDKLCPQLPEAYHVGAHLILLGDSRVSDLIAALQASDLLLEITDHKYPGPGRALVSFAWSPFALERNVILVGACDAAGVQAGVDALLTLAP